MTRDAMPNGKQHLFSTFSPAEVSGQTRVEASLYRVAAEHLSKDRPDQRRLPGIAGHFLSRTATEASQTCSDGEDC
jgi:hypothetical protein